MIKKKEIIGVLVTILILLVIIFLFKIIKKEGDFVIVKVNGSIVATYDLNVNGTYELNDGSIILCINNKKAYLLSANCPDKLCIKQGEIDDINESIVCLPNKLSLVISGKR